MRSEKQRQRDHLVAIIIGSFGLNIELLWQAKASAITIVALLNLDGLLFFGSILGDVSSICGCS